MLTSNRLLAMVEAWSLGETLERLGKVYQSNKSPDLLYMLQVGRWTMACIVDMCTCHSMPPTSGPSGVARPKLGVFDRKDLFANIHAVD